tara:strand:+ start:778 stop:1878 length:1101 start_codon:yes stop_codon:yes gene_type:complete
MKITKSKLAQIIKEELAQEKRNMVKRNLESGVYKIKTALDRRDPNMDSVKMLVNALDDYITDLPEDLPDDTAMSESDTDTDTDPLGAAENQGIQDAQDDFMRSKRGEGVSPDNFEGSPEEKEAYGKAWGRTWHRLMDNAVKNRVDMERELDRPPEPETDADREAAEAEFDFESTFSEGTNRMKKGNKMKITKTQLKRIIKEELEAVTEDVLDYIEKGDTILVPDGNILLKQDGRVIFSAKNRDGESLGDVVARVNDETIKKLRGGGTMEKSKITPLQKEMNDELDEIISAYDGAEVPPSLSEMKELFNAGKHAEAMGDIQNHWEKLLRHHQRTGTRLKHEVTTGFNTLNTLGRKMPDSVGGQVGQK